MPGPVRANDFAKAFGNALVEFLQEKGLTQAEAARRLGLGKAGKARINTYCRKAPAKPDAEILYLLCVQFGFSFDYRGYRISTTTLGKAPSKTLPNAARQTSFDFARQFELTDKAGEVSVTVKRPSGRIEVTLSLDAAAS